MKFLRITVRPNAFDSKAIVLMFRGESFDFPCQACEQRLLARLQKEMV